MNRLPFLLDAKQRSHAHRCALAQTIINGWLTFSPQRPSNYLQTVENIISLALTHGVESDQGIALLATYSLQIHPRLLTHAKIKYLIDQSDSDTAHLNHLLSAFNDVQWEDIRTELGNDNFDIVNTVHGEITHD